MHSRKKKSKKHKFRVYQRSMEIKSYAYEVLHIHNALQEWNLSKVHGFLSFLNEVGLLSLMNDKNLVVWGRWILITFKNKFLGNKIA